MDKILKDTSMEKTLYNLEKGDVVTNGEHTRTVLYVQDGSYIMSDRWNDCVADGWFTSSQLEKLGFQPVKSDTI